MIPRGGGHRYRPTLYAGPNEFTIKAESERAMQCLTSMVRQAVGDLGIQMAPMGVICACALVVSSFGAVHAQSARPQPRPTIAQDVESQVMQCERVRETAIALQHARQMGWTLYDVLQTLSADPAVRRLAGQAFEIPRQPDFGRREDAVHEFADRAYLNCLLSD